MATIVQRVFSEAFNQGDLAVVDELVAPGGVTLSRTWGVPASRRGFKQWIAQLRTAFPDLQCTVEDEINQAGRLAAHWIMRGTHRGPFLGNPPTQRPVGVHGLIFSRIQDGQVVEGWTLVDQLSLLQQLGLVPPP